MSRKPVLPAPAGLPSALNLKTLLENTSLGVVIHDWDTTVVYANPAALRALRMTQEQITGRDALDPRWYFVDAEGVRLAAHDYPVSVVRRTGLPLSNRLLGVHDSSREGITWFNVNAYPEPGQTSGRGFIIVSFAETGEERASFSYQDVLHNTQDIVVVTDAAELDAPFGPRMVYVNRAFETLTGYSAAEACGQTPRILQGRDTSRETCGRIREALLQRRPIKETLLNYSKSGRPYWLEIDIFPLCNRSGEVTHFAAIERDVTEAIHRAEQLHARNRELSILKNSLEEVVARRTNELRAAKERMELMAYRDDLTGLPNRRAFFEQATRQWAHALRHHHLLLVGMVDIDHFKQVNDLAGHDAGDAVLAALAEKLRGFFRAEDGYGRLGGEEFGFVVMIHAEADARVVGDRLRSALRGVSFDGGAGSSEITVSVGLYAARPGDCPTLKEALRRADQALFEAKHSGRDVCAIWSPVPGMDKAAGPKPPAAS